MVTVLSRFYMASCTKVLTFLSPALKSDIFRISLCILCLATWGFLTRSTSFSMPHDQDYKTFIFLLSAIFTSLIACFLTKNPIIFFIFLEITALPIFFLINYFSKDHDKLRASLFIICINIFGSIPFFIFVQSMNTQSFFRGFLFLNFHESICERGLITFCLSLILLSKVPVIFLHFWLTKAHVAASAACSMLLASLMLKLGTFGLIRYSVFVCTVGLLFTYITLPLRVFRSFVFSIFIIRYFDLKGLVACSSIVHMALLVPFCINQCTLIRLPSILIMLGHGLSSLCIFFIVSLIYERFYNRSIDFTKNLERVGKSFSIIFLIFFFFNFGVPPFINFLREFLRCSLILRYRIEFLMAFMACLVRFTVFFIFVITKSLFGKKNSLPSGVGDSPRLTLISVVPFALFLPLLF